MIILYVFLSAVFLICIIGFSAAVDERTYTPREGDIVTDRGWNVYRVLTSDGRLSNTITAIEINPVTKEVKHDAVPIGLKLDDIQVIEYAKPDWFKVS